MITTKAENCRAKARQCEEMARLIGDRRAREELQRIVRDLTETAERLERDNSNLVDPQDSRPTAP